MNATLQKFGYPDSIIHEYGHWVVMIRPKQITFGCVVIAATSHCTSLGDLMPEEAAQFPNVVHDYETTIKKLANADKFNYLCLMMVDPNPHFHGIPRYARELNLDGLTYRDRSFPKPPDLSAAHELDSAQLGMIKQRLIENWIKR
jgi:diadenosine tetraphosphate (Ap4A) HIT family hydrolase